MRERKGGRSEVKSRQRAAGDTVEQPVQPVLVHRERVAKVERSFGYEGRPPFVEFYGSLGKPTILHRPHETGASDN